jgi:hypothetical protein
MIQRIQTLWLLISTICGAIMYYFPIYEGLFLNGDKEIINVRHNIFLLAGVTIVTLTSLGAIFLYKKRTQQKLVILVNCLVAAGVFVAQYFLIEDRKKVIGIVLGDWEITAMMPLLIIICHLFAFAGIRKDEKLLSSADRMR